MKRPRPGGRSRRKRTASAGPTRNPSPRVNEMLKACLQKVCELQEDLKREDAGEDDARAAGYAACAAETLRFLQSEGMPEDHPVVQTLRERLFGDRE